MRRAVRPRVSSGYVTALLCALGACAHSPTPMVTHPHAAYAAPVLATTRTGDARAVACSPADAAAARVYRTVPPEELERDATAKPMPQLADGEGGYGQYLVAADRDGHVTEVRLFQRVPGNLAIAAALCQWKFKPQPQPRRAVLMLGFKPIPRRFR